MNSFWTGTSPAKHNAQRTAHEYVRYLRDFASHNEEPSLLAVKTWVASTPSASVRRKRAQAIRAFGTWCETIVLVIDKARLPRVEFYIAGKENNENIDLFQYLLNQREEIEAQFGSVLVWDDQERLVSRRIMSYRNKEIDINDVQSYAELIEWMMGEHEKFRNIIVPLVENYSEH